MENKENKDNLEDIENKDAPKNNSSKDDKDSKKTPPSPKPPPNKADKFLKLLKISMICLCIIAFMSAFFDSTTGSSKEITYSKFLDMIENGQVQEVEISKDSIKVIPYDGDTKYSVGYLENDELIPLLQQENIKFAKAKENSGLLLIDAIFTFLPTILIIALLVYTFKAMTNGKGGAGGIFGVGKSRAKLLMDKDTGVTFADVAGQDEAKESLEEIIDYLKNTEKYRNIGAKLPKGALLVGPPGTGKTLLARSVAGEAKVPFFNVSGSDFVEMFVGVGASRVRDLFEEAKKVAPCIIFIDEIDAIGKSRDSNYSNDERDQTLNQLLSEMDGFDSTTTIVVLGATNRPEVLDKALLRPGRFDRRIIIDKPDFAGRVATLKVHAKDVKVDESVNFETIAYATSGASGADLANIINEAALGAVKYNRDVVTNEDLMEAVEVVFAGKEKKDRVLTERERKIVSYHEVGHAVVAALQKNSSPVQKITIVPRTMGSLGYTMQIPEEEKYLNTSEEILEEITTLVGGRCAEEIFCNTVTTGASNDIERATDIARKYVTLYGMSDEFGMVALETVTNAYLDGRLQRNCSDNTSTLIDNEIKKIISECKRTATNLLTENQEMVHEIAEILLDKENITGDEFMDVFRAYYPDGYIPEPKSEKKPSYIEKSSKTASDKEKKSPNVKRDIESKEETVSIPKEIPEKINIPSKPSVKNDDIKENEVLEKKGKKFKQKLSEPAVDTDDYVEPPEDDNLQLSFDAVSVDENPLPDNDPFDEPPPPEFSFDDEPKPSNNLIKPSNTGKSSAARNVKPVEDQSAEDLLNASFGNTSNKKKPNSPEGRKSFSEPIKKDDNKRSTDKSKKKGGLKGKFETMLSDASKSSDDEPTEDQY